MNRFLFICSRNKLRSPTAEAIFASIAGLEVYSAGTETDADNKLSAEDIEWADSIFVMENSHKNKLNRKFSSILKNKKIVVLDIPDEYDYMEPRLVELLRKKMIPFLPKSP